VTIPKTEISPGLWLDARRALFIAPLRILVVADLHWGYVEAHRAAGNLLPRWGDTEIATQLRSLIADYAPREMIWLGDSLHKLTGRTAAEMFLDDFAAGPEVFIVSGNHDHRWPRAQVRELQRPGFYFHHGDDRAAQVPPNLIEVIGHHHPAVSLHDGAGTRLKLPALVASPRRLIMPAFSPWAAGTNWLNYVEPKENLWAIAPSRIFAVKPQQPGFGRGS
jgi:metallophosphoesterase superfamily enzyme